MSTLSKLLLIAEKQIGIVESPPNSNKVLYNDWYYKRSVSGPDYPWCMVFCQWVYDQAGIKLPIRTASCTTMMTEAKRHKCWVNNRYLQPGDLVLYNFKGQTDVSTHCGIIKTVNGIKMEVIEGNTAVGNDTDGGRVMIRNRTTSQAIGAFRPIFDEEVEDMTVDEFIDNLTPTQAKKIVDKARTKMAVDIEPTWSKQEGHWKAATDKKIIDGTRPEDLVKRDEMIAIVGRLGLINK